VSLAHERLYLPDIQLDLVGLKRPAKGILLLEGVTA